MDVSCPSLRPKILVADKVRPNAQTTAFMAAHGCHLSTGCLFVLLVIIESFFLVVRDTMIARTVLYKVSIAIVSRSFYEKRSLLLRYSSTSGELPDVQRTWRSQAEYSRKVWGTEKIKGGSNSGMVIIKKSLVQSRPWSAGTIPGNRRRCVDRRFVDLPSRLP